jgi:CheY-like chemotaxis protein
VEAKSAGRGKGSEFVVTLPLATVEPLARLPPGAGEKPSRAARSWRILVVDDNADAAESLAAMLRLMGHQVETAPDGQAAVRVADRSRPELMLLDIGMPRMNGHELARHVRKQPWGAATALVALTGWGDDRDRRRSLEAGFDHHLTKPVDAVSLGRLLAAMSEGGPTTNSELGVRSAPPEATEAGAG